MPGALVFGAAASDRATHSGTDLNNLSAFTWVLWVYVTTLTDLRMFCAKDNGAAGQKYFSLNSTAGNVQAQVSAATTNAFKRTNNTPIATNAWRCMAATYDGTDIRIYHGRLNQAMAECTYAVSTSRSGAANDDSGQTFMWGADNATLALQGRIAVAASFNAALALADLESWRRCPRKTVGANAALRFVRFGKYGADGIDYGAANNPVITGATQGNGVPLRVRA